MSMYKEPWGGALHKSDTSQLAAASVKPHLQRLEAEVFRVIGLYGPLTCDDAERITELSHQCVSARVRALVLAERIYDTGRTRPTRSGRQARVYAIREPR